MKILRLSLLLSVTVLFVACENLVSVRSSAGEGTLRILDEVSVGTERENGTWEDYSILKDAGNAVVVLLRPSEGYSLDGSVTLEDCNEKVSASEFTVDVGEKKLKWTMTNAMDECKVVVGLRAAETDTEDDEDPVTASAACTALNSRTDTLNHSTPSVSIAGPFSENDKVKVTAVYNGTHGGGTPYTLDARWEGGTSNLAIVSSADDNVVSSAVVAPSGTTSLVATCASSCHLGWTLTYECGL